jgi:hypothetical protein
MEDQRLRRAVPDGEALRYTVERRRSDGAVGVTDERLLVVDEEVTSVHLERIEEVAARDVDWFVAVTSAALVVVGVLAGADNALGGMALVAAGVASLVLVYWKRGKVTVSVEGRGKPVEFYVDATDEFVARLGDRMDAYERRLAADTGPP